ncbi:hypothetical protein GLYMA_11G023000v4 [Glycine max]|uniref:Uncharacterized protein n=1 Tax=Glycine max TaxID=3847 RepID=A0A0R0HKY4_SOYBN|nr:hypothetical protein GYH30_029797 [Glycine max]KRH27915.1 hypothetical protein GLYMA_11G023000v4 [Glycine max]
MVAGKKSATPWRPAMCCHLTTMTETSIHPWGSFYVWCIETRKPSLSEMQMGFQTQALLKLTLVGVNAV